MYGSLNDSIKLPALRRSPGVQYISNCRLMIRCCMERSAPEYSVAPAGYLVLRGANVRLADPSWSVGRSDIFRLFFHWHLLPPRPQSDLACFHSASTRALRFAAGGHVT